HAQFVEHQTVVLFFLSQQVVQALLAPSFLLLKALDDVAVRAGGVGGGAVTEELIVGGDLLPEELLLKRAGHPNALEGAVRGDDAVPHAASDLGGQELAALTGEILLRGDQEFRIRVELQKLSAKLFQ